jgi:hypothetical protein
VAEVRAAVRVIVSIVFMDVELLDRVVMRPTSSAPVRPRL